MPGPPIRKPSDHSPPAGSPRNIAGHHVLHRPLMPRHPPNAQKNKQQMTHEQNKKQFCRRNLTVRCSRPLYSSQPTHPHPPKTPRNGTLDGPGNPGRTAPEPRQHATPTRTKHARGHPPPPNTGSRECVSYTNTDKPATPASNKPTRHDQPPIFPQGQAPAGPDPFNSLSKIKRPGSHPHT